MCYHIAHAEPLIHRVCEKASVLVLERGGGHRLSRGIFVTVSERDGKRTWSEFNWFGVLNARAAACGTGRNIDGCCNKYWEV